jgi:chitin synthase
MAHIQFHDSRDVPIPTTRPPMASAPTLRRAKTLTRPERGVAPVPLINPQASTGGRVGPSELPQSAGGLDAWVIFSLIVTFWAPTFLLKSVGGLKDKQTVQAWREKMALCFLIIIMCGLIGFATVGFQRVLCPPEAGRDSVRFIRVGSDPGTLGIRGVLFNISNAKSPPDVDIFGLAKVPGQDITPLFQRDAASFASCRGLNFRVALDDPCTTTTPCPLGPLNLTSTYTNLGINTTSQLVGYDWDQVSQLQNYIVIDGAVLNLSPYMTTHPTPVPADKVDAALRVLLRKANSQSGKDGTRLFFSRDDIRPAVPCLLQRYKAGNIDKVTPGCFVSNLTLYAGLFVILGLVLVRFVMACLFNWWLSSRLAGPPDSRSLNRSAISPAVMPEGANISIDNRTGTAPWAGPGTKKLAKQKSARSFATTSSTTLASDSSPIMSLAQIGAELFAVCLVTCYSEGEDSLRTTLDSISTTNYSDGRKLLFVVADGMITGAGEKRSTPDICVSLLEADPRFGNPMPMGYIAVGSGSKGQNRAMVYAGHYSAFIYLFIDSVFIIIIQLSPVVAHQPSSS